jgi:hypothetical protein
MEFGESRIVAEGSRIPLEGFGWQGRRMKETGQRAHHEIVWGPPDNCNTPFFAARRKRRGRRRSWRLLPRTSPVPPAADRRCAVLLWSLNKPVDHQPPNQFDRRSNKGPLLRSSTMQSEKDLSCEARPCRAKRTCPAKLDNAERKGPLLRSSTMQSEKDLSCEARQCRAKRTSPA